MNSVKSEKFRKLAGQRANRAIKAIRLLAQCANRRAYEYTNAESAQLIYRMQQEVDRLADAFRNEEGFEFRSPQYDGSQVSELRATERID